MCIYSGLAHLYRALVEPLPSCERFGGPRSMSKVHAECIRLLPPVGSEHMLSILYRSWLRGTHPRTTALQNQKATGVLPLSEQKPPILGIHRALHEPSFECCLLSIDLFTVFTDEKRRLYGQEDNFIDI